MLTDTPKVLAHCYRAATQCNHLMTTGIKPKRNRRDCPIRNCNAVSLLKLSEHLQCVHKIYNKSERMKWLGIAKKVYTYDTQKHTGS